MIEIGPAVGPRIPSVMRIRTPKVYSFAYSGLPHPHEKGISHQIIEVNFNARDEASKLKTRKYTAESRPEWWA